MAKEKPVYPTLTRAEADALWRCPRCGADANEHGPKKPQTDVCGGHGACMGLLCDCEGETSDDHGTYLDPCKSAICYHCDWGGQVPSAKAIKAWKLSATIDPAKLTGWQRDAWDAGWRPTK